MSTLPLLAYANYWKVSQRSMEDPTDIFDTSLSSLFSIPPIAFSSSSNGNEFYTYTPPSSTSKAIQLKLPSPPSNLYTTLQANQIWLSSIYLSDLISLGEIDVRDENVCELGAGAGLPGIVALRDGHASSVVSSDWGVKEILDVLEDNFKRACEEDERRWNVVGHEWGTDSKPLLKHLPPPSKFDVLLLADVLWVTEAHSSLIETISNILGRSGKAHITAGLHTGRGPINRFITKVQDEKGWKVEWKRQVRWRVDGDGWEEYNESMRNDGNEEERGVVIWFILTI